MPINFFNTVFQSLLINKEKELIVWPLGNGTSHYYTGDDIIEKIAAMRMALLRQHVNPLQSVLLAKPVSIDLVCALFALQAVGALVSYSSGSTGNAKAVYRSHKVLLAQHEVLKEVFPSWPGQIDSPLFLYLKKPNR